jgi:two-component system response regulator YesN
VINLSFASDNSLYSYSLNNWFLIEKILVGDFEEKLLNENTDFIRLLYIDEGSIELDVFSSDQIAQRLILKKFDFLLIDSANTIINSTVTKNPLIVTTVLIKREIDESFNIPKHIQRNQSLINVLKDKSPFIHIKRNNSFNKILKLLEVEAGSKNRDSENKYMQSLLFSMLLVEISREYSNYNKSYGSIFIKKAIDYIYSNYEEDIKLDDIAENLFISTSYLRKLFKSQYNETFVNFLTNVRLERAKELLTSSSLSMIEITNAIGMNNRENFQRIFTKVIGLTPGNYRKLQTLEHDVSKGTDKKSLTFTK